VLSQGLITLLTLGIWRFWRFWQVTAQRRPIWAHTKLTGEPFGYLGTGRLEKFIGAAVVAALLSAMMPAAQMALGWLGYASPFNERVGLSVATQAVAGAAMLLPLIEYARFHARRCRLGRARWRAIRFDMRGSGLGLVARWAMWAPVVVVTLGLAAPFLTMARERHMIERTLWGDEPMFFPRLRLTADVLLDVGVADAGGARGHRRRARLAGCGARNLGATGDRPGAGGDRHNAAGHALGCARGAARPSRRRRRVRAGADHPAHGPRACATAGFDGPGPGGAAA
jgi:hypothetical protein